MFENEVAFRNLHYSHSRFSLALARRLSFLILLMMVALTTASFAGSNFDRLAELPRVTVPSAMADTPAPGSIITVNAGGDLQSALDNTHCGGVVELQAGATSGCQDTGIPDASSGDVIPSTFFGMTLINTDDWPSVTFGELGKGTLVRWPYVEQTKGVYNWSTLDRWVFTANSHNVPFDWTHNDAPPWAVTDQTSCVLISGGLKSCSANVTDLSGFQDFITALATRYDGNHGHGRIGVYELYNEPETFFTGTMANLVAQTRTMYNAIKAADPNALIVGLGMTYPDRHFTSGGYMDQYWAAGGVKTLDAVSFHGYTHHNNDAPESVNTFVPYVKAALVRNGISSNTPIWDTEGSWGNLTEAGWNIDADQQIAWPARSYLLHWSNGVSRFYWYAWDGIDWGALSGPNKRPHPAALAYQQVYNWMVGATMSTPCAMAPDFTWTCDLTRPGGYEAQAVWNTLAPMSYVVPIQYTKSRDLTGAKVAIPPSGVVTIGSEPILLEAF